MSEVVAESVQTQSDGTLWAITVQTVDEGDFGFEVESQVKARIRFRGGRSMSSAPSNVS